MTQDMTDQILPAQALVQLDQRERNLLQSIKTLDELRLALAYMTGKSHRKVTVADVALAADIYGDLSQLFDAVQQFAEEPRK